MMMRITISVGVILGAIGVFALLTESYVTVGVVGALAAALLLARIFFERLREEETTGAARPFRIVDVLSRGFPTLFHNIVPFGVLALLFSAPLLIFEFAAQPTYRVRTSGDTGLVVAFLTDLVTSPELRFVTFVLLCLLLSFLLTTAVVYGTVRELKGSRARPGECIVRGLASMLPGVGAAILMWLALVVGVFLMGALAVYGGLGGIIVAIPGAIILAAGVMMSLWVAIPAAVVGRAGVFEALGRSANLTAGNHWRVIGLIAILAIIPSVVLATTGTGNEMADVVISWLMLAVFAAMYAVMSTVSYRDLRVAKDGVDAEEIAAPFD